MDDDEYRGRSLCRNGKEISKREREVEMRSR